MVFQRVMNEYFHCKKNYLHIHRPQKPHYVRPEASLELTNLATSIEWDFNLKKQDKFKNILHAEYLISKT